MSHDRELFKGAAWYYARYRLGYPASFFAHVIAAFGLDKTSRVLDLGTGTGQIAISLAGMVREVIAIDPEMEMLEEGKIRALEKGIKNIIWTQSRAEDITSKLGTFKATTIGAAFHWMEQENVLEKVYQLTEDGGGVAIVANTSTVMSNKGGMRGKTLSGLRSKNFLARKGARAIHILKRRKTASRIFWRGRSSRGSSYSTISTGFLGVLKMLLAILVLPLLLHGECLAIGSESSREY